MLLKDDQVRLRVGLRSKVDLDFRDFIGSLPEEAVLSEEIKKSAVAGWKAAQVVREEQTLADLLVLQQEAIERLQRQMAQLEVRGPVGSQQTDSVIAPMQEDLNQLNEASAKVSNIIKAGWG